MSAFLTKTYLTATSGADIRRRLHTCEVGQRLRQNSCDSSVILSSVGCRGGEEGEKTLRCVSPLVCVKENVGAAHRISHITEDGGRGDTYSPGTCSACTFLIPCQCSSWLRVFSDCAISFDYGQTEAPFLCLSSGVFYVRHVMEKYPSFPQFSLAPRAGGRVAFFDENDIARIECGKNRVICSSCEALDDG